MEENTVTHGIVALQRKMRGYYRLCIGFKVDAAIAYGVKLAGA